MSSTAVKCQLGSSARCTIRFSRVSGNLESRNDWQKGTLYLPMASITFPHADTGLHAAGASSSSTHDLSDSYFSGSYEAPNASYQIQMNPLSSHPPRTPRTSVTSSSVRFGSEIYTSQEIAEEAHIELSDDIETDDEDEKAHEEAKSRIRKEVVWQELLTTANGRDKAFVCLCFHRALGEIEVAWS